MARQKKSEILSGYHSVFEALKASRRTIYKVLAASGLKDARSKAIVQIAAEKGVDVEKVPSEILDRLTGNARHQGVAARVSPFPSQKAETMLKRFEAGQNNCFFLVLENLEDPHNLGALLRTAVCAGVDAVMVAKNRTVSPAPSVSRISAGAMEHADICLFTNTAALIRKLKKLHVWVAGLDARGETSLFDADLRGRIALVLGGEHKGIKPLVRRECDFLVSIPIARRVDSLNASVAGAVAMYEAFRQRSG